MNIHETFLAMSVIATFDSSFHSTCSFSSCQRFELVARQRARVQLTAYNSSLTFVRRTRLSFEDGSLSSVAIVTFESDRSVSFNGFVVSLSTVDRSTRSTSDVVLRWSSLSVRCIIIESIGMCQYQWFVHEFVSIVINSMGTCHVLDIVSTTRDLFEFVRIVWICSVGRCSSMLFSNEFDWLDDTVTCVCTRSSVDVIRVDTSPSRIDIDRRLSIL
jgi:hypothetical protein